MTLSLNSSMKKSEKISIAVSIVAICISAISLYISVYVTWFAPTFEQLVEEGNIHLEKGEYWKAIRCYDKALEIKPDDPNVLRDKGYAFINLGIDNESISVTQYSDAKKFIDYYFECYKNQSTMSRQYYFERAFQCFSEAKILKPEDPEILFYYVSLGFYLPTGPDPINGFNEIINTIENLPPYKKEQYPVKLIKRCSWYGICIAYKEYGEEVKVEECFRKLNETN